VVDAYTAGRPRKADEVKELWGLTHQHQRGELASREDILAGLADATAFNLNNADGHANRVPTAELNQVPESFTAWTSEA
jgi:hypothetical protein